MGQSVLLVTRGGTLSSKLIMMPAQDFTNKAPSAPPSYSVAMQGAGSNNMAPQGQEEHKMTVMPPPSVVVQGAGSNPGHGPPPLGSGVVQPLVIVQNPQPTVA